MNVFIFGDTSVVTSSTEEYIKSAFAHLEPTRVLLDGHADISIIASHCCRAIKIPYSIFLPAKSKSPLNATILSDSQNIIYFNGTGLSGNAVGYTETLDHIVSLASLIIYVSNYTRHDNLQKSMKLITRSKKPHLIIPA